MISLEEIIKTPIVSDYIVDQYKRDNFFDSSNGIKKYSECLHKQCTRCKGTGVTKRGEPCLHYLSCQCPKCTPQY